LVTDSHSVLARWRSHSSQLLNDRGVNDDRQTEIHTAEPLVHEPSSFEIEVAIERPIRQNTPRIDQIPAQFIEPGGRVIPSEMHELLNSIWNLEDLPEEWKESIIIPIYKKGRRKNVVIIQAYHSANYVQNFIQHPALKVNSICRGNYWRSSM